MAADVARHLAAGGVPDVDGVVQVEVLGQAGKVVGVVVHVVALTGLRGAAVPAPVMGDHAVAVVQEEHHLGVPVVGRQGREWGYSRDVTAGSGHHGQMGTALVRRRSGSLLVLWFRLVMPGDGA